MAEEECALGGHSTRNIVCCAKHHLEVPCSKCLEIVNQNKEVSKNEVEEAKVEEETKAEEG